MGGPLRRKLIKVYFGNYLEDIHGYHFREGACKSIATCAEKIVGLS
jgi:hypothetical protein